MLHSSRLVKNPRSVAERLTYEAHFRLGVYLRERLLLFPHNLEPLLESQLRLLPGRLLECFGDVTESLLRGLRRLLGSVPALLRAAIFGFVLAL